MKTILKTEEFAMTAIAVYFLTRYNLGLSWWVWALLFFSPDISMLGYLHNTKTGAVTYNLFHHKGIAICIAITGLLFGKDICVAIGILLFAHASFDRIMGYGLKYSDSFKNTHLGSLEKTK
jgi:ABC-type nitrate/sulfonate/bicarbonate transport system permease component